MTTPSVGSVSVDVVPSARNFAKDIRKQVLGEVDSLGKEIGEEISKRIGKPIADAVGDSIENGIDKANTSGKAAKKGRETGGAFAKALRAELQAALSNLPDAEVDIDTGEAVGEVAELRKTIQALLKDAADVDVDLNGEEALARLAEIRAAIEALAADGVTIDADFDYKSALANVDAFVDRVRSRVGEAGQEASGAFATAFRDNLQRGLQNLPEINVPITAEDEALKGLREQILALSKLRVGVDISTEEALAKLAALRAALVALGSQTTDVRLQSDIQSTIDALDALPNRLRDQFHRAQGALADEIRGAIDAAVSRLPDIHLTADSSEVDQTLARIRAELEAISRDVELGIGVDDGSALARLAVLRAEMAALAASTTVARVRLDLDEAIGDLDRLSDGIRDRLAPTVDRNAGAFAKSLKAAVTSAVDALPEIDLKANPSEVNRTLAAIRAEMVKLGDLEIGVDIQDSAAIARLAGLRASLMALRDAATDIQVQMDLDEAIDSVDGFLLRMDEAGSQAGTNFSRSFRDQIANFAAELPSIEINADSSNVDLTLAEVQRRLAALSDKRIGIDIDAADAMAEAAALEALLRSLPNDIDIDIRADVLKVTQGLAKLRTEAQGLPGNFKNIGEAADAMGQTGGQAASFFAGRMGLLRIAGIAILALLPLIAAAVLTIPAAIGLIAAPIAAVIAGMDGLKVAVAPLTPAFQALQAIVSSTFIQTMQPAIQNIAGIIPTLTSGLSGTASALSTMAAGVTSVVSSGQGLNTLSSLFTNINSVIVGLTPSIATLVQNFLTLAEQGTQGLLVLGDVMNQIGETWNKALAEMTQTGTVSAAVSQLVQIFGGLMEVITPLVQIGAQLLQVLGPVLVGALQILASALEFVATAATKVISAFQGLPGLISGFTGNIASAQMQVMQFGQGLVQSGIPGLNALGLLMTTTAASSLDMGAKVGEAARAMTPLATATQAVTAAQTAYTTAVRDFGPNSQQAISAAQTLAQNTQQLETIQKQAADAAKTLSDQLKDQATAFQSVVGSTLAYEQALLRAAEAATKTAEAVKKHGANSKEAKTAILAESQAIEQAAQAAQKMAEANTAGLGPQAQQKAGVDAYTNTLLQLASNASPQARLKLLELAQGMSDTQLASASAAAAASKLKTEVITLPNGKTITVIADVTKAVDGITKVHEQGAAPVTSTMQLKTDTALANARTLASTITGMPILPTVQLQTDPALANARTLASTITGIPILPVLNLNPKPGELTAKQFGQQVAGDPATKPLTVDPAPANQTLDQIHQKAQTAAKMPVTAETQGANAEIDRFIQGLLGKKAEIKPTPNFGDANSQLDAWIQGLGGKPMELKPTPNLTEAERLLNEWIARLPAKPASLNIGATMTNADTTISTWTTGTLPLKVANLNVGAVMTNADTAISTWTTATLPLKVANLNVGASMLNADTTINTWTTTLATRTPALLPVNANTTQATTTVNTLVATIGRTVALLIVNANPQRAQQVVTQLVNTINRTVGTVITQANVDPAVQMVEQLVAWINSQVATIQVGIAMGGGGVGGGSGGGDVRVAQGAIIQRNAAGRVNDLRPMSGRKAAIVRPNTWRIIGDRIHGSEAFIPINNSARSMALLKHTANQMGQQLTPLARGGVFDKVLQAGMSAQRVSTQQTGNFASAMTTAFGNDSPDTSGAVAPTGNQPLIGTLNQTLPAGSNPDTYTNDLMFALRHAKHGGLYSDAR